MPGVARESRLPYRDRAPSGCAEKQTVAAEADCDGRVIARLFCLSKSGGPPTLRLAARPYWVEVRFCCSRPSQCSNPVTRPCKACELVGVPNGCGGVRLATATPTPNSHPLAPRSTALTACCGLLCAKSLRSQGARLAGGAAYSLPLYAMANTSPTAQRPASQDANHRPAQWHVTRSGTCPQPFSPIR